MCASNELNGSDAVRIRFAFAAKAVWELARKRLGVRIFAQSAKFRKSGGCKTVPYAQMN